MNEILVSQCTQYGYADTRPDCLGLAASFTEHPEECVNEDCYKHEVDDIKRHRLHTCYDRCNKLIGEVSKGQTVLVEGHPEEQDDSKNKAECHDTFLGLLGGQFFHFLTTGSRLFSGVLHMLEPRATSVIDSDTEYQRSASYREGEVQPSFDKQYVRDWLTSPESGWDKKSGELPPELPEDVIAKTRDRYIAAYEQLTGKVWDF